MVQNWANVLITDSVGDVLTVQGATIAALGASLRLVDPQATVAMALLSF